MLDLSENSIDLIWHLYSCILSFRIQRLDKVKAFAQFTIGTNGMEWNGMEWSVAVEAKNMRPSHRPRVSRRSADSFSRYQFPLCPLEG